jgi:hypothetical protein
MDYSTRDGDADGARLPILTATERTFIALAIQGLCMRQGPASFALATRCALALGLTVELADALGSWIAYSRAEAGKEERNARP